MLLLDDVWGMMWLRRTSRVDVGGNHLEEETVKRLDICEKGRQGLHYNMAKRRRFRSQSSDNLAAVLQRSHLFCKRDEA